MAGFASAHSVTLQAPPVLTFFHTNRKLRSPPVGRRFTAHSGWWADTHDMKPFEKGSKRSLFKREEFPFHARFASHQAFKYQWLAQVSKAQGSWTEPWLLMDTDTVVQCSKQEIRQRFWEMGAQLVVGGECVLTMSNLKSTPKLCA